MTVSTYMKSNNESFIHIKNKNIVYLANAIEAAEIFGNMEIVKTTRKKNGMPILHVAGAIYAKNGIPVA